MCNIYGTVVKKHKKFLSLRLCVFAREITVSYGWKLIMNIYQGKQL